MTVYSQLEIPREGVLEAVRASAFATLTPRTSTTTHLGIVPRIYPEGHTFHLVDRKFQVPEPAILVFLDEMPGANFGHPCRYLLHSPNDGRLIGVEQALFPPDVSDPHTVLTPFHAPLGIETARPTIYSAVDWAKIQLWPWLTDDNRYALLFTSQISNR